MTAQIRPAVDRERPEQADGPRAPGCEQPAPAATCVSKLCFHPLPLRDVDRRTTGPRPGQRGAGQAGRGGGRESNDSPNRWRGARSSHGRPRRTAGAGWPRRRALQTIANVAVAYRSTSCEPVAHGCPSRGDQHGDHREHRQRVGVEPRREQRPAPS